MSRQVFILLLTLLATACSRPGAAAPAPQPSSHAAAPSGPALARRADEALAATLRPDYQLPRLDEPDALARVSALYLESCRAGVRSSCWLADATHHSDAATEIVRRNCLAGDLLSCRALPADFGGGPDRRLPGWAGRSNECIFLECRNIMRRECEAGFTRSCSKIGDADLARATIEALEACRAGVLEECYFLSAHTRDRSEAVFAFERICRLAANCTAGEHIYANQPLETRDALERSCQYGRGFEREIACTKLILGYLEGAYPEPVPGRARALADWYCGESESSCTDGILEQAAGIRSL